MLFNNICIRRRRVCRIDRGHDTALIDKLYSFLVKKYAVKMDYCNYFDKLFLVLKMTPMSYRMTPMS